MKLKTKKSYKAVYFIVALIAILAIIVAALYFLNRNESENTQAASDTSSKINDEPSKNDSANEKETVSEDIPKEDIPDNVDLDNIKSYSTLTENEKFKVRKLEKDYVVTLYPIVNNSSQYETYTDQLKEYKQQALNYMSSQNIDIRKVKITYEPAEAANL